MEKNNKLIKINLGCGIRLFSGFVNVDLYDFKELSEKKGLFVNTIIEDNSEYLQADIRKLPFSDNYADYVECLDVLEHIPMYDILDTCKEIQRVMKPGSMFLGRVPSFNGVVLDWLRHTVDIKFNIDEYYSLAEVIYGNQKAGGEFHTCPFTNKFLTYILKEAGFAQAEIALFPKFYQSYKIPKEYQGYNVVEDKEIYLRNDYLFFHAIK